MFGARVRLALLWVSQVARVVADWGLRVSTVLALQATAGDSAWHLASAAFIAPPQPASLARFLFSGLVSCERETAVTRS